MFQVIVDCFYTTKLHITFENYGEVISVAQMVQNNEILSVCEQWLKYNVSTENCSAFIELAEKYCMEKVKSFIAKWLCKSVQPENCVRHIQIAENYELSETSENLFHYFLCNFIKISRRQDQLKDIPEDLLVKVLSSDKLFVYKKEIEVFRAVRTWLSLQENPSRETVVKMFKTIRLGLVPEDKVKEEVYPFVTSTAMESYEICKYYTRKAIKYHEDVHFQPLYTGPLNRPRGIEGLFHISSGDAIGNTYNVINLNTDIFQVDLESKILRESTIHSAFAKGSVCLVKVNNFLFLFGIDNRSFEAVTARYDASISSWETLEPVPHGGAIGSTASMPDVGEILLTGKINNN